MKTCHSKISKKIKGESVATYFENISQHYTKAKFSFGTENAWSFSTEKVANDWDLRLKNLKTEYARTLSRSLRTGSVAMQEKCRMIDAKINYILINQIS